MRDNGLSRLTFLGTNSLYVLMCRKAINQSMRDNKMSVAFNAFYIAPYIKQYPGCIRRTILLFLSMFVFFYNNSQSN